MHVLLDGSGDTVVGGVAVFDVIGFPFLLRMHLVSVRLVQVYTLS